MIKTNLMDISFTSRDVIGFNFEVLTSKLLDRYGIEYNSNVLGNIIEWKKHQGKGVDFKISELNIELEAKSGYAKIFKSWILRDWIPRFSYHNEVRIVIVKPTLKLSDQCLELLFYYNINLIYPDSLSYLVKRGNKLLEVQNTKKEGSKNQDVEKQKQRSEIEGLELMSSKSSSTFRDKFRTKLKQVSMNLLSSARMLVLKLWKEEHLRRVFSWL
jgi:hypothetical protein